GQGGAADPGRRPAGDLGREGGDRGDERVGGAGHPSGDAHDEVDVDLAAVGQAVAVEQPAQRRDLPEVEQLELRHDLALLGELVKVADEPPGVHEDVVAEVRGAHGQAARVGRGVEHAKAVLERVVHRAAGGELDEQVGALPQCGDGIHQPLRVEGRAVLVVA